MAEDSSKEIEKEIEEIKKLRPEERINKIRELEEKRKKEKEEIDKLLEESFRELKKEERIKEIKVPEPERIDVEKLFREEGSGLEKRAAETAETEEPGEKRNIQYRINLAEPESIYNGIKELGTTDTWGEEEFREFYRARTWLESVDVDLLKDEVAEKIIASKNLVNAISKYIR